MKDFLIISQCIGIYVMYLLFVTVITGLFAFKFFDIKGIDDESEFLTFSTIANVVQAAIAITAIVLYMRRFR